MNTTRATARCATAATVICTIKYIMTMAHASFEKPLPQSRVMHYAHILYEESLLQSVIADVHPDWSASVAQAWKMENVLTALNGGIVKLHYLTESGEENWRIGSRSDEFIPIKHKPRQLQVDAVAEGYALPVYTAIAYFDITKWAWRSFKVVHLISAELMEPNIHVTIKDEGRTIY